MAQPYLHVSSFLHHRARPAKLGTRNQSSFEQHPLRYISQWLDEQWSGVGVVVRPSHPLTKEKARRRYRLLIIDGHGSHVTKAFIDYCDENKILLFIFPPHATHTLQPLDVVCFKSLASNYSNELTNQYHRRLGESPMNKSDFLTLFIPAWERTFTNKLVKQAFECTGIHPRNADVILDRFRTLTPQPPATPPEQTITHKASTEPDIHKFSTLVDSTVRDQNWDAANAVKQSFHQVLVRFELEKHEK